MSAEHSIHVEHVPVGSGSGVAAFVELNRPDKLNALDWPMIRELQACLRSLDGDSDVRVVFVIGRGRAFSAGGDLQSYLDLQEDPVGFPAFLDDLHSTFMGIAQMKMPVIALVNGVTAAGGLELLLSCDFAYAAEEAAIGDAHLNFGQIGGGGSLALLPRAISPGKARELIFSGRFLTASEALDWGLVNKVVPGSRLREVALEFAQLVSGHSPASLAAAKSVLNGALSEGTGVSMALRLERERAALYCMTLPDSREGLLRFAARPGKRSAVDTSASGNGMRQLS